jgi:hypothetical protein
VLPFVVPVLAAFWLRGTHRPPASAPGRSPLSVTQPISTQQSPLTNA